jgi:hypothetical protein
MKVRIESIMNQASASFSIAHRWKWAVLLLPIVFIFHDLEEGLTIERFWANLPVQLPEALAFVHQLTTLNFAISVGFLFILLVIVAVYALIKGQTPVAIRLFTFCVGLLLLNAITHLVQMFILRSYIPGIITSVLLLFPYTILTLMFLFKYRLITRKQLAVWLAAGAVVTVPLIFIVLQLGWWVGMGWI